MSARAQRIPSFRLMPSTGITAQEGLRLGLFEEFIAANPDLGGFHRHPHYEVFLLDGEGAHVNDFRSFPISGPSLVLVAPGQVHGWEHAACLHGPAILFERDFYEAGMTPAAAAALSRLFLSSALTSPVIPLGARAEEFFSLGRHICQEYQQRRSWHHDIIRFLLGVLLLSAVRLLPEDSAARLSAAPPEARLLRDFQLALERHYTSVRTIPAYAALLHISPASLNRIVRELSGKSPATLLRDRLTLEAKRLLVHSPLPVQEIASQLNFPDTSYFTKFFRKATGMTPSAFKVRHHRSGTARTSTGS